MKLKKRRWLLVLAFVAVNYGARSQTSPSPIVVPRPDIEAVVQAMSTKTCEGIVTGKQKQVAADPCSVGTRQVLSPLQIWF